LPPGGYGRNKVLDQLIHTVENVRGLYAALVEMIPLAALIVEANDTNALNHVRGSVRLTMMHQ
jgi:hypothetical protein